jgi:hypothetical protein
MPPENSDFLFTLPDKQHIKISRSDIVDPFINYKQFYVKYLINKSNTTTTLPSFIDWSFYKTISNYRGL